MKTTFLAAFSLLSLCGVSSVVGQTLEWTRQLGTSSDDWSYGISADRLGNAYVTGPTDGGLEGINAGGFDAFLSKYNASGTLVWTRQLGTSETDWSRGVSVDTLGNVYISGYTGGSLGSGNNAGERDAFLSKYDADGIFQWTQQLGTSSDDLSLGVSVNGSGNVFVSGTTRGTLDGANAGGFDAFLSKYNASGTLVWTRQLGTNQNDLSYGVSADGQGNIYISGITEGSLGADNAGDYDAFLSKYDDTGALHWTRQIGSNTIDWSEGVSADESGNVYISGWTLGSLEGTTAGGNDAFLSKYDASGTLEWTRQIGTSSDDGSTGVRADGLGNVYISGWTDGNLGATNAGDFDAFLSKYDDTGALQWTRLLGTSSRESKPTVTTDGLGSVFISGHTEGSLEGVNVGGWDLFLAKYSTDVSELAADFDGDGDVDGDDFLAWQTGFGAQTGAQKSDGDYDDDGDVDGNDFLGWQMEFGSNGGPASGAVPEPAAALLMMILMSSVACLQRCRKAKRVSKLISA